MMQLYIVTIVCFAAASHAAPQKRLSGGADLTVTSIQWVGSLQQNVCGKWTHVCGGVVLGNSVHTAAHCVPESANINDYRVVFGTNDLTTSATIRTILSVGFRDPQFAANGPGFLFDFTSLGINSQMSGLDTGGPVTNAGVKCDVFGWRRTSGSSEPSLLHRVTVHTISLSDCKMRARSLGAIIGSRDTCVDGEVISEGDSGSPLRCGSRIRGVASWSGAGVTIFTGGPNYAGMMP